MTRFFDEYMTSNTRINQHVFGYLSVVYTSTAGGTTLDVFFNQTEIEQISGYDGTIPKKEKTVQCVKTDLGSLPYDGYFTIEGTKYQIADIQEDDLHQITFLVREIA